MDDAFGSVPDYLQSLKAALKADAAAQAEYARLDDLRKSILAQIINGLDGSYALRESTALSNQRYLTFLSELAEARRIAKDTAAEVKYLEIRFDAWRTRSAFQRIKQGGR